MALTQAKSFASALRLIGLRWAVYTWCEQRKRRLGDT